MSAMKRLSAAVVVALVCSVVAHAQGNPTPATQPVLAVTPNTNVLPGVGSVTSGDVLLQRQTEPMIAVSTRNADHLMVAANDYRTVDIATDPGIGELVMKAA